MTEVLRYPSVKNYLLPFFGGLLYASSFPFYQDQTFILGGVIGMFLLLNNFGYESYQAPSFKTELLSVLCFSLGHYLLGHYWIAYTLNVFGGVVFPFDHLLGLFFSLVILPHFLVFTGLNALLRKLSLNSWSLISGQTGRNLIYALLFTLLEYWVPQQFPAHLGHGWLALSPYLGLAPYLGAPVFSFFSYLFILCFVNGLRKQRPDFLSLIYIFIFVILNIVMPLKPYSESSQKLHVRMVQPNIGNYLKLSSEAGRPQALSEVLDVFHELSTKEYEKGQLDMIIWPETAYPRLLSSSSMKGTSLFTPDLIARTQQATKAELFTGGYDQVPLRQHDNFFETEYNAAFFLNKSGNLKGVYHKHVLIPFGESLPFGPLNETLSGYLSNVSFFAKGSEYTSFKTESGWPFVSAICYEILFSSFIRDILNHQEKPPSFLINLTNDSWYGDTSEPFQHLFLAKWRSLEFDLPVLRMTNTGITSVLYPDGTESERLMPFEKGNLDVALPLHSGSVTLFQRYGILGTVFVGLFLVLLSWPITKIVSSRKPKNLP